MKANLVRSFSWNILLVIDNHISNINNTTRILRIHYININEYLYLLTEKIPDITFNHIATSIRAYLAKTSYSYPILKNQLHSHTNVNVRFLFEELLKSLQYIDNNISNLSNIVLDEIHIHYININEYLERINQSISKNVHFNNLVEIGKH